MFWNIVYRVLSEVGSVNCEIQLIKIQKLLLELAPRLGKLLYCIPVNLSE